jgi:hypothetical protein
MVSPSTSLLVESRFEQMMQDSRREFGGPA